MRVRKQTSKIAYSILILSGIIGIGLCCFFGFGDSPTIHNVGYILLGILMAALIAFGYRGITRKRRIGNEIWWQLLIAGLIWAIFVALFVIFIFTCLAMMSGGQAVF